MYIYIYNVYVEKYVCMYIDICIIYYLLIKINSKRNEQIPHSCPPILPYFVALKAYSF